MGRKRAKAVNARSEVEENKIKVAEASLAEQKKKNRLIEEHHELFSFTSNTDNSDPLVREYMQIKRRRALDRLKASDSKEMNDETTSKPPSQNPQ